MHTKEKVEEGDFILLYGGRETIYPIHVTKGTVQNTKYGSFHHDDIINALYGHKAYSKGKNSGWLHILPSIPELYTLCLYHRTQILYAVDISQVILELELRPGSIVVESGTGSGSLTCSLARTVFPHGQVFTFEFHVQRAAAAEEDFKRLGVSELVTVTNRDVCAEGFLVGDRLPPGGADGVFLDLPAPWDAVKHAKQVLKRGGMFCSFSPCIEQVQRCAAVLSEQLFGEIETIECLLRPYDVRTTDLEEVVLASPPHNTTINSTAVNTNDAGSSSSSKRKRDPSKHTEMLITRPHTEIQGHTGYLTFARKLGDE